MTSGEIRAAITDQLGRFARRLDTKNWNELGDVFADDVIFDYGGGREGVGLDALRDMFRRYLDRCGPSQHLLGSIIVDLTNSERPVSSSYVQARHSGRGELSREWFDTNGEYRDTWRCDRGAWYIIRRMADFPLMVGNPAVIAFEDVSG